MVNFETEHLRIRHFFSSDIKAIYNLFSDYETMKFIGPKCPMSYEEASEWLANQLQLQNNEITRFAVALKKSDELIGVCGIQKQSEEWDFGYYFRRAYWGNGYAIESCSAILFYIENELGYENLVAFVANKNFKSIKLLCKLGFIKGVLIERAGEIGHLYHRCSTGASY